MKNKDYSYHGKEFFSRKDVAENYDKIRFTSISGKLFNDLEMMALKKLLLKTKGKDRSKIRVLEIGSGTGRFSIELAKMGFDVVCSDISKALQEEVRKKLQNKELKKQIKGKISLKVADAYNLPFKDESFDMVICIRVFNQLKLDKNKKDALKQISRVLKKNGIGVIEYVNLYSLSFFAGTFQGILKKMSLKPYKISGLISHGRMKKYIDKYGLTYKRSIGIFFFSQTFFIYCPKFMVGFVARIDSLLSYIMPFFCTRVFVRVKK